MNLRSIFNLSFLSSDLAIDLGTANTLVYAKGKGIVVSEPSIVAVNKVTGKVEAVGKDAKEMLGRTPGNIVAIRPMKDGVIADFEITEKMLSHFIRQGPQPQHLGAPAHHHRHPVRDDPGREARGQGLGPEGQGLARSTWSTRPWPPPSAPGLPITEPSGNMVVDIGGGTTDIAVISLAGIVYSKSVRVAGNEMDEAIIQYIKKKYNLLIGERTAEQIKMEIGSAFPLDEPMTMEIKGRDLIEGIPKTLTITDAEIREALAEPISIIVNAVRVALERTPPELSRRHRRPRHRAHRRRLAAQEPRQAAARGDRAAGVGGRGPAVARWCSGTGKMLSDFDLLRKISLD